MVGTMTWLKQVSGALCALLLLAFTVVPAADALLCAPDAASMVSIQAAADQAVVKASASSDHSQTGHQDGGDVCVHGHCHHPGQIIAPFISGEAIKQMVALRLAPGVGDLPPSNQPDGPKEPPRA
ncbi:hypothetical protein C1707_08070 [Caulobacter flavus]|jgi:hypothetical protein|uniref:DUF2946 domain-containing protein n=2 Tax=Caulobacter flavus TaxID=1679497 RepID=A0ABM6ZW80_9CAUL|nr:hypothetical protein C1707_08070 [Caulobacter flavus]